MADKQDAAKLAQDIARRTEVSATTSPTPVGPTEAPETLDSQLIETINQIFALFRLNYHNQYYAAWSDAEQVKQVKLDLRRSLELVPRFEDQNPLAEMSLRCDRPAGIVFGSLNQFLRRIDKIADDFGQLIAQLSRLRPIFF